MMKQTDNSHTPQVSVAVIDNYDSFTYNLVHLVRSLGAQVTVFRNDQFDLPDLADYDKLLLSPGPGIPSEAGLLLDVIRTYAATVRMSRSISSGICSSTAMSSTW